jgi:hypothetical protein
LVVCLWDKTCLVFATPVFPFVQFLPLTLVFVSVIATSYQSFPKGMALKKSAPDRL